MSKWDLFQVCKDGSVYENHCNISHEQNEV